MSALAIGGGLTRNAAAVTTWPNAAGWEGNYVIYMNAWISSVPDAKGFGSYELPEWNVSAVTTTDAVKNAVGVAVGVRSTDANGNLAFYEYYDKTGGSLVVKIPLAVIGESYTYDDWNAQCVYESVQDVYLPYVGMSIKQEDNFGINATGTLYPGTPPVQKAQNDIMADAYWTGVDALLGGVPVSTWVSMYQSYVAAAKAVGSPNVENFTQGSSSAGQQVIQSYDVTSSYWGGTGNSPTYNVFGPSMYVEMTINATDFSTPSTQPALRVYGENWINPQGSGCIAGQVLGANIPLDIFSYPAIEVEGTVRLGTQTLPNQPLTLSDGGSNVYTFSTLGPGNYQGNYRFFAKPGTAYTLSTTYGGVQYQKTFTTGTDPTGPAQYDDLNIPAFTATPSAYPNPTQVGYNEGFQTALSGAFVFPVSYSWNFGDGTWTNGTDSPYHIYTQSGDMTVTLRASDSGNPKQWSNRTLSLSVKNPCSGTKACINPASQTVYYNKGGSCNIPTASFAGYAASTDQPPFQYGWAFGDGGTGSGQSVSHTYPLITTTWTVTLTITNATGHKTTATATVTVKYLFACSILSGTLITLAGGGTKSINSLEVGDAVLAYDVSAGSWIPETVTANTHDTVSEVLSINNGLLETTLRDQPLYVRNGTWTGWVRDPRNLTLGEQLFLPTTGSWVTVTSLQMLAGSFKVYDLSVSAPDDFVANGVLAGTPA